MELTSKLIKCQEMNTCYHKRREELCENWKCPVMNDTQSINDKHTRCEKSTAVI